MQVDTEYIISLLVYSWLLCTFVISVLEGQMKITQPCLSFGFLDCDLNFLTQLRHLLLLRWQWIDVLLWPFVKIRIQLSFSHHPDYFNIQKQTADVLHACSLTFALLRARLGCSSQRIVSCGGTALNEHLNITELFKTPEAGACWWGLKFPGVPKNFRLFHRVKEGLQHLFDSISGRLRELWGFPTVAVALSVAQAAAHTDTTQQICSLAALIE